MRNLIKFGAGLAGASAGAAIGVLLTTEKGKKVRNIVTDHFKSGIQTFKDSKENFSGLISELTTSKKTDFETTLSSIVDKASDKTEHVIAVIEQKLSEMKAENKGNERHTSDIKDDVVYKAAYETKVDL